MVSLEEERKKASGAQHEESRAWCFCVLDLLPVALQTRVDVLTEGDSAEVGARLDPGLRVRLI